MLINKDVIKKLNPCSDRFNNYLSHYNSFNSSVDDFLDLPNITYSDKIWVATKLLNRNQLVHFGLLCAESVLNIFEDKNPSDKRVRDCIEYLKTIKDFSNLTPNEKEKIQTATNAANAAANAANAATSATSAAYDAYAANAANAATSAAYARNQQENLNLEYLKMAASL